MASKVVILDIKAGTVSNTIVVQTPSLDIINDELDVLQSKLATSTGGEVSVSVRVAEFNTLAEFKSKVENMGTQPKYYQKQ